jgi:hypothetical protein
MLNLHNKLINKLIRHINNCIGWEVLIYNNLSIDNQQFDVCFEIQNTLERINNENILRHN